MGPQARGGGFRGCAGAGCFYLGIRSGLVVIYVSYPDLIANFDRFGMLGFGGVLDLPASASGGGEGGESLGADST